MSTKKSAPKSIAQWKKYYESVDDGTTCKKFRGSCSRQILVDVSGEELDNAENFATWLPITAFHQHKKTMWNGKKLSGTTVKSKHPWFLPKRRHWKKKLSLQQIQNYKNATGKDLVPHQFAGNSTEEKNFTRNYDKELFTPHHLISCCVTEAIHSQWKNVIEDEIGYNVNSAQNLVVLTNSADLACYLAIPLHEGGHDKGKMADYISVADYNKYVKFQRKLDGKKTNLWQMGDDAPVIDTGEINEIKKAMVLKAYHSKVFKMLTPMLHKHFKKCKNINDKKFIMDMNRLSKRILTKLKNFEWVLSEFGEDYKAGSPFGCRNVRVQTAYAPGIDKKTGMPKLGHDNSIGEIMKVKASRNESSLPVCKLDRNHDYLETLLEIKHLAKQTRAKMGMAVASELPYG